MTTARIHTTTDHDEIRRWAEAHHGTPAELRGTADRADPGVLRIDFPGATGLEPLEPIEWSAWFRKFDDARLSFVYHDPRPDGSDVTFFKFVAR